MGADHLLRRVLFARSGLVHASPLPLTKFRSCGVRSGYRSRDEGKSLHFGEGVNPPTPFAGPSHVARTRRTEAEGEANSQPTAYLHRFAEVQWRLAAGSSSADLGGRRRPATTSPTKSLQVLTPFGALAFRATIAKDCMRQVAPNSHAFGLRCRVGTGSPCRSRSSAF